LSQMHHYNNG